MTPNSMNTLSMTKNVWLFFTALIVFSSGLANSAELPTAKTMHKDDEAISIAKELKLEGHMEGGFFRRTYESGHRENLKTPDGERFLMTSIYYMLTHYSPIGHWHLNKSDIIHYYHMGDPIEYTMIYPDGKIETQVMGSNVLAGEKLQLTVKGGIWKTSRLLAKEKGYGLISEAVSPGFDYADMTLGSKTNILKNFPQHGTLVRKFLKPAEK